MKLLLLTAALVLWGCGASPPPPPTGPAPLAAYVDACVDTAAVVQPGWDKSCDSDQDGSIASGAAFEAAGVLLCKCRPLPAPAVLSTEDEIRALPVGARFVWAPTGRTAVRLP